MTAIDAIMFGYVSFGSVILMPIYMFIIKSWYVILLKTI